MKTSSKLAWFSDSPGHSPERVYDNSERPGLFKHQATSKQASKQVNYKPASQIYQVYLADRFTGHIFHKPCLQTFYKVKSVADVVMLLWILYNKRCDKSTILCLYRIYLNKQHPRSNDSNKHLPRIRTHPPSLRQNSKPSLPCPLLPLNFLTL